MSLRDLHSAAVEAGLGAAKPGSLNLLALEGNPGIGKTTAVQRYLTTGDQDGFLMLYFSPRTVINRDVTEKFGRHDDTKIPTGILTLTTNGDLIAQAPSAWRELRGDGNPGRHIDAALVVDGVTEMTLPQDGSTWFIDPATEDRLKARWHARGARKQGLDERTEELRSARVPGVLRTLASGAATLLKANPDVTRIVLTASIQSYGRTTMGSTIDSLSQLFQSKAETRPGRKERQRFAERFPSVLVMVDEIAGDRAGALLVKDLIRWLGEQFIDPFEHDEQPPFTVSLIIADASLGNEVVLESYLRAAPEAPPKVIISAGAGAEPLRLAAKSIRGLGTSVQALHVMTNSYPAERLDIAYRVKLHRIEQELDHQGQPKTLRARIRSQGAAALSEHACAEILSALHAGAVQVIFFAQDKCFLRDLQGALLEQGARELLELTNDTVSVLDSSVTEQTRKRLLSPQSRDRHRVFLMTSSGARGISFPRATHIIAMIPRFDIESNLMELAQLIYRGRGSFQHPDTGAEQSGDDVPRHLVMLVDDWLPVEIETEDRRAWLRRVSDLLTLVMMLRATLFTRITGDAGLLDRKLALVPVGPIASEDRVTSLAEPLDRFLQEATTYVAHREATDSKGLISEAISNATCIFTDYGLIGRAELNGREPFRSWSDIATRQVFASAIASQGGGLLPEPGVDTTIPDHCHCLGPLWLENWSDLENKEHFRFESLAADQASLEDKLLRQLGVIAANGSLALRLQQAARELHAVLDSPISQGHVTQKGLARTRTWLALPLDWPLPGCDDEASSETRSPRYPEEWLNGLQGALGARGRVFPVLPKYRELPFAVSLAGQGPILLAQTLKSGYFMASTELNLLNTILLAERGQD